MNTFLYNGIVGQATESRRCSQWAAQMGFHAQMSRSTLCVPFTICAAHPFTKGIGNEMVPA